jgi:hypothetical protein
MRNITFLLISITTILSSCGSKNSSSNSTKGNWSYIGESRATTRTQVASFTLGDTAVYFIGGYYYKNKEYCCKDVWKATINNNGYFYWVQLDSMPSECLARTGAIAFAIANKGYYGLGYSENTGDETTDFLYLTDFWEFDPSQPKGYMWTRKSDFIGPGVIGATGFGDNINNKGFVICGKNKATVTINTTYVYDPNNGTDGTWTKGNGQSYVYPGDSRAFGMNFTINNKTYVFGGINSNNEYLYDLYVFDPSQSVWTKLNYISNRIENETFDDKYTMQRQGGSTFVLNDKGYLTLGYNAGYLTDTWEYNPNDDRWRIKTSFENAGRTCANGFSLNGRAFVCFGNNETTSYYNGIYEFQPDADVDVYDN